MYNRSINALVIGYILTLLLIVISGWLLGRRIDAGIIPGIFGVLSLASAYMHEELYTKLMAYSEEKGEEYEKLYGLWRLSQTLPALSVAAGYLTAIIVILGV